MLSLQISLTRAGLERIKLDLIGALPSVKSSHRCEALGRGLGFRTYASLSQALNSGATEVRTDGGRFAAYLLERGAEVPQSALYFALGREAMRLVQERLPILTLYGFGLGEPKRLDDGKWETGVQRQARFEKASKAFPNEVAGFLASLVFLDRVPRTKSVRRKSHSYWLKHIAENHEATFPDGEALGPTYVGNGVLIAAANHLGFTHQTGLSSSGLPELNAAFNMSYPALVELDIEVRPDGARAQDRRARRGVYA